MWHSAYYNEEKTVENYEQQLHSTALALGRELDYTILSSYNTVTKNAYLNYLLKNTAVTDIFFSIKIRLPAT